MTSRRPSPVDFIEDEADLERVFANFAGRTVYVPKAGEPTKTLLDVVEDEETRATLAKVFGGSVVYVPKKPSRTSDETIRSFYKTLRAKGETVEAALDTLSDRFNLSRSRLRKLIYSRPSRQEGGSDE